ncbi:hypothetical protein MVES_003684 [Malassezia vespertilionis]|uniref:Endonuclease/exonuclease/phosphatase domain-containing protein n=1 Tax=Malassezia vespertilionis TaxID=2020962 RepID=A0A2N1J7H1_9BASI|nr:hypothetical protein MVES_003684 [Malassezia vespertilionis]
MAKRDAEQVAPRKRKRTETSASQAVSPAAPSGADYVAPPFVPRNTSVPEKLEYTKRAEGHVRICIWNITSLKSSDAKGLMRYIAAEDADIVVLSETKVNAPPEHAGLNAMYKYRYWGIAERKGYAGVAVLSKYKPDAVHYGLPGFDDPSSRARVLTLEFSSIVLVGTYAVNAGEGLKQMETKMRWFTALEAYLQQYTAKGRHVVWAGDLNVVWDERDLSAAPKKWEKAAGYTALECNAHRKLLAANRMQDAWRVLHPDDAGVFSYYGWRGNCRVRGAGWRLDSFMVCVCVCLP